MFGEWFLVLRFTSSTFENHGCANSEGNTKEISHQSPIDGNSTKKIGRSSKSSVIGERYWWFSIENMCNSLVNSLIYSKISRKIGIFPHDQLKLIYLFAHISRCDSGHLLFFCFFFFFFRFGHLSWQKRAKAKACSIWAIDSGVCIRFANGSFW